MRSTQIGSFYDVVVLGTELAPLTCAALLGKRGFRVLVLGQQSDRPDYALGKLRLPRHPFAFSAAHAPAARRVLSELGLGQSFRRVADVRQPALQVALPGHRFDLPLDDARLEREIEREFPEVKRPILDFNRRCEEHARATDALFEQLRCFPPESLFERRDLSRLAARLDLERPRAGEALLSEFPEAHPFRSTVRALLAFSASCEPEAITELQLSRLWSGRIRDALRIDGGLAGLHDLLLDRIRSHSGELRMRERASHVVVRRGAACGVRLFGSDEEIGCQTVVSGIEVAALQRLLSDRDPLERLFERLGEPQPRFYRYALNAIVRRAGIPEGLSGDALFIRNLDAPRKCESLLHVEHTALDAERSLLCVEGLLPARAVEERDGSLDELRERMLGALGDLVPFVGEHLLVLDSPHDGRKPWARASDCDLSTDPYERRGPETMRAVHAFPVTTALSVCAMPVKTPLRGLLLCNRQVAPGLGVEGELITASSAAQLAERSDRGREWMRRRLWTKVEL